MQIFQGCALDGIYRKSYFKFTWYISPTLLDRLEDYYPHVLDDLTDHLTEWMSSFKNIFFGGDFNIHIDDINGPEYRFLMIPWKAWDCNSM